MNYLILDIETVPRTDVEPPLLDESKIKFGNTKDVEKRKLIIEKEKGLFKTGLTKKMSIDSNYARILSIGGIFADKNFEEISRFCFYGENDDKEILDTLKKELDDAGEYAVVGWNSKKFDIPMINKRGILNGNRVWPRGWYMQLIGRYQNYSIDLMNEWNFPNEYGKLSDCAKSLGIDCKSGMDGSMIYKAYKDGKKKEIMDYNISDCEATLEILKRIYL